MARRTSVQTLPDDAGARKSSLVLDSDTAKKDVLDSLVMEPHKPDGKPKFAIGGSATIAYAKAHRESKKGEDANCIIDDGTAPAGFAVFDGHSGQRTAKACAAAVLPRIMETGAPFTAANITDVLWTVDEEIGSQKVKDGATAQILLVEPGSDGGFKLTFAWW